MRELHIRLPLTEACDLRCSFCHNEGQAGASAYAAYSGDELSALLESCRNLGKISVKFTGGEPTLHPRFTSYVEAACRSGATEVAVVTNGQHLRPILDATARNPMRVSLSLPCIDAHDYGRITGGDLTVALRTVRALVAMGVSVVINSFLGSDRTRRSADPVLRFAAGSGLGVKLILPCHVVSHQAQLGMYQRACGWLENQGYEPTARRWNATIFRQDAHLVRLLEPWCPRLCKDLADEIVSVRISGDRRVVPCLGLGTPELPLDLKNPAATVATAMRMVAAGCHGSIPQRIRIVRRRTLS